MIILQIVSPPGSRLAVSAWHGRHGVAEQPGAGRAGIYRCSIAAIGVVHSIIITIIIIIIIAIICIVIFIIIINIIIIIIIIIIVMCISIIASIITISIIIIIIISLTIIGPHSMLYVRNGLGWLETRLAQITLSCLKIA